MLPLKSMPLYLLLVLTLGATPPWRDAVLSDVPDVRAKALAHLHELGRSGLYSLQDLVGKSTEVYERARFVRALGELGDPAAEWQLRLELRQPSAHVKAAAVRAISQLKLAALQKPIVELVGTPDPELCEALGLAAADFPAILDRARADLASSDTDTQLGGLRTLNAAGAAIALSEAKRFSESAQPELQLAAAVALGKVGPEASTPVLQKLLEGPVANAAIEAAGKIDTPAAIAMLSRLLSTPRFRVRGGSAGRLPARRAGASGS